MRQAVLLLALIPAASLAQAPAPTPASPKPAQAQAAAPTPESPKRKSGLWEVTTTDIRSPNRTREFQMCIDQASDDPLQHLNGAMRNETCKASKVQRSGDQITVDAVCTLNKTTAKTHSVITGKFDSAYKIESKSTFDPPLRERTEGTATVDAKWLGPCGPDQKPGDVVLPSGKKINVNDRASAPVFNKPQGASQWNSPPNKQSSSPGRRQGGGTSSQGGATPSASGATTTQSGTTTPQSATPSQSTTPSQGGTTPSK